MRQTSERAPYVSVDWLRNYLQRVWRSAGAVLDKELAAQVGATGNNWTQLLRAARELGIVDDEGRLTDEIGLELAAGGKRSEEAAKKIVERTYPSLVARLNEPLDTEAIKQHFYDVYRDKHGRPLGESARRQAAALFRFWIEQTGNEEWIAAIGGGRATRREAVQKRPPRREAERPVVETNGFEEVINEQMPFYRAAISVPTGRRLSTEEWELVKQSVSSKIDYLKKARSD